MMEGGQGNDTYVVDDADDVVTEVNTPAYAPPAGFTIKGTADLDGDGDLDVLLLNHTTNATQLQVLQNGVAVSTVVLPSWNGWPAQGFVEVNGDGRPAGGA